MWGARSGRSASGSVSISASIHSSVCVTWLGDVAGVDGGGGVGSSGWGRPRGKLAAAGRVVGDCWAAGGGGGGMAIAAAWYRWSNTAPIYRYVVKI